MLLADRNWVTEDEEYKPEDRMAENLRVLLQSMDLDTYNNQFLITVRVSVVDSNENTAEKEGN